MQCDKPVDRFMIFARELIDQFARGNDVVNRPDALPRAEDVLPALGLAEHFADIDLGASEVAEIAGGGNRLLEPAAAKSVDLVGVDDVGDIGFDEELLQTLRRRAFGRVDEPGPDIPHVGAGRDRAGERGAVADTAAQDEGLVSDQRPQFSEERERVVRPRMTASARCDGNDAIDIGLERLLGMTDVDDVMEAQTAIGMNGVGDLARDTDRGDQDRNLIFHGQRNVLGQPRVRLVNRKLRRPRRVRRRQPAADILQPILIAFGRPLIEGREGTDEARTTGFRRRDRGSRSGTSAKRSPACEGALRRQRESWLSLSP